MRITISFRNGTQKTQVEGELNESPTAKAIADALPVRAGASTWGDEIYFGIPVTAGLEPGATDVREIGDLAYWPPGHAFCIFFGSTPASHGDEPRAASPVNLVGRLTLDAEAVGRLRTVRMGTQVVISATESSS